MTTFHVEQQFKSQLQAFWLQKVCQNTVYTWTIFIDFVVYTNIDLDTRVHEFREIGKA